MKSRAFAFINFVSYVLNAGIRKLGLVVEDCTFSIITGIIIHQYDLFIPALWQLDLSNLIQYQMDCSLFIVSRYDN